MRFDAAGGGGSDPQCTICRAPPVGPAEVSLHGELTCVRHDIAGRCLFCGRAHGRVAGPGWRPFTDALLRCPTCVRDAVENQTQARRHLPRIRSDMAAIGVALATRVLVRLVPPSHIAADARLPPTGVVLGVTEQVTVGVSPAQIVEIRIAAGQPMLHFGASVAHEIGHAWLVQQGAPPLARPVEEGLCQLFAHGWLKRRPEPLSEELRRQLRLNPDPVYGAGFRTVHAAARRHGVGTVLTALCRTGELPRTSR